MNTDAAGRWTLPRRGMSRSTLLGMVFAVAGLVLLPIRGTAHGQKDTQKPMKQPHAVTATEQDASRSRRSESVDPLEHAKSIGYSEEDIRSVPKGVICRGCGNPIALAAPKAGETVLDLGSGAGFDAFLSSQKVGPSGKVVGVDMDAEIVAKATESSLKGNFTNVLFKQGKIEHLPLENDSVDVAISNCVINYCPDKVAAFQEIRRCLKPNGRMVIADLVTVGTFSAEVLEDKAWGKWLAVASGKQRYLDAIEKAGFREIVVVSERTFPTAENDVRLRGRIISIQLKASK
jgi:arsenite methyltransferase